MKLDNITVTFDGDNVVVRNSSSGKKLRLNEFDPAGKLLVSTVSKLADKTFIDWKKVPPNTAVVVKDEDDGLWEEAYFATYCPKDDLAFYVFVDEYGDNCSQEDAYDVEEHKYCLLSENLEETN